MISATFERHADLDQGHQKLTLRDAKGMDHVNPKSWKGDVQVGKVELAAEWIGGQYDTKDLLEALWRTSLCQFHHSVEPAWYRFIVAIM